MRTNHSLHPAGVWALVLLVAGGCSRPTDDGDASDTDTNLDGFADADRDPDHDGRDAASDATSEDGGDDVPPLSTCEPVSGSPDRVLLRGTLLTPDEMILDGEILVLGDTGADGAQRIACVGEVDECATNPDATGATVICTDGIILPGLIDSHNHIHYNILPRWRHDELYEDRYEWQSDAGYQSFKDPYDELNDEYLCQMVKYAEARIAISGATAVQGCRGARCIAPLVRNVEWSVETSGLGESRFRTRVSSIDSMSASTAANLVDDMESGDVECFIPHLAEGINEESRAEFDVLEERGLMRPETTIIHATGATTGELAAMAGASMHLVWSPVSNIDLYGMTTRVTVAHRLSIPIALAPDWTPSGSMNLLEELHCADELDETYYDDEFSDEELVRMITSTAAEALHLEDLIGRLQEGLFADVTVIAGDRHHPWRSVIEAHTRDVRLVLRGGELLYGEQSLVEDLAGPLCESLDVCGIPRTICVAFSEDPTDDFDETLADLESTLETALMTRRMLDPDWDPSDEEATYEWELFDLFSCDPPPSCAFGTDAVSGVPDADDADGDDVPDASDVCPRVFDPDQSKTDGDGVGDACDPCPLDADTTDCTEPSPSDTDGDTIPDEEDNCPSTDNPLQPDDDGDGRGDACDACPSHPNPPGTGCPYTIFDIQDESSADHPVEGTEVHVEGVVVTAVNEGSTHTIWVQDPAGGPYSGVAVFLGSTVPSVERGDVVDVDGTTAEYLGYTEIDGATVTFVSASSVPAPAVLDPADIADGGPDAEAYEGVLVRVESVTVTDANPDAPSDYNEFVITGGLRVDDFIHLITPDPVASDTFSSLTGIHHESYSHYKVLPRDAADVVRP